MRQERPRRPKTITANDDDAAAVGGPSPRSRPELLPPPPSAPPDAALPDAALPDAALLPDAMGEDQTRVVLARSVDMVINVDGRFGAPLMKVKVYNSEWDSDVDIYVPISMKGQWPQFPTIGLLKEQIIKNWGFAADLPKHALQITRVDKGENGKVFGPLEEWWADSDAVNDKMHAFFKVDWGYSGQARRRRRRRRR